MKAISVSALNEKIRSFLEATFIHILVEGEVASVTYHRSGHLYFSIKDDKSTLRCVMWRSNVSKMKFRLEVGERIVVNGSIAVYVPRGEYQLMAVSIEPYGRGSLALAFEQLKKKLEAKGYFDKSYKKALPRYPKRIALVTASGGAALQDMIKIAKRRWALCELLIIDTLVQGEGASESIARAISYADSLGVDIIVTGRGGGSIEDLWAFNEEIVARAIFEAKTPIVSAVGHEVDTLISDFVADLRAPTPSAAMEMILPDSKELLQWLDESMDRIYSRVWEILNRNEMKLKEQTKALQRASIFNKLEQKQSEFRQLKRDYQEVIKYRLSQFEAKTMPLLSQYRESIWHKLDRFESQLKILNEQMKLQEPSKKTKEGWAEITVNAHRTPLRELEPEDEFKLNDTQVEIYAKVLKKSTI